MHHGLGQRTRYVSARSEDAAPADRPAQHRCPDRATEVAERGNPQLGWALVVEQVRLHRRRDAPRHLLPEARPEAPAEHDALDVEQVHRRGDAGAERAHRALDQFLRELVAVLQRVRPDPAAERVVALRAHDLEEIRLAALALLALRLCFHRAPPGVGLEAARAVRTGSARRRA